MMDVIVSSPNWKRKGRLWEGVNDKFQEIEFSIEDEVFWKHVMGGGIKFSINDIMTVQWVYVINSQDRVVGRVLKVFSFNEHRFVQPVKERGKGD